MLAARRAGMTAASSPTPVASRVAPTNSSALSVIGKRGAPLGSTARRAKNNANPAPIAEPMNEPLSPSNPP